MLAGGVIPVNHVIRQIVKNEGNQLLVLFKLYQSICAAVLDNILKSVGFDDVVYIDLFKGLQNHYLPRKCGLCGLYYLLEATAYSPFCTRPVKGRRGKTCRDLGHRKTYTDKVNSDPILLTYTKAYKQHYARYLKKKMTQAEFREWADLALELRQRAYDKELSFEEYEAEIRK